MLQLFMFGLLIFGVSSATTSKTKLALIFDDLKCISLNNIIRNVTCEVTSDGDNGIVDKWSLEFDITSGNKIDDVFGNFSMLQKEDGNRNQYAALPDVNNYTVDFCSHLNSYTTALFFRAFSTGLQKYGNMFHSCPFSGHAYTKDLQIRLKRDMFPDDTPIGDFLIDMIIFMRKKGVDVKLFEMQLFFAIEKE